MPKFFKDDDNVFDILKEDEDNPPLPSLLPRLRVDYSLSSLFFRIGVTHETRKFSADRTNMDYRYIGRHLLVEASWLNDHLTWPREKLLAAVQQAVDASKVTRLNQFARYFADQSFIIAIVIEESHIIMHGYADGRLVIDAYTCGTADPQAIVVSLCQRVPITLHHCQFLARGLHEQKESGNGWCTDPAKLRLGTRDETLSEPLLQQTVAYHDDTVNATGVHGIAEFYGCASRVINDADNMTSAFEDACESLNIDILEIYQHPFQPQGLSVTFVGQGFHMTVHSWPELYYAPVDIYYSDPAGNIQQLLEQLQQALGAQALSTTIKERGAVSQPPLPPMNNEYRLGC